MAKKKQYEYNGQVYTLQELSALYGVSTSAINNRLHAGWDFEAAIKTPMNAKKPSPFLPPEFANGNIVRIVFTEPIPQVFPHMQPQLNKEYVVTARECYRAAPCYFIHLENGQPLIVYPEEFQIVSITPQCALA